MKTLRLFGIFLVPMLTIIYGLGEINHWWDILSGRQKLLYSYERLSSGNGFPISWIYENEFEFKPLRNFIESKTKNSQIKQLKSQGIEPSLITIDGGGIVKWPVPENWPKALKVPPETQIMFLYGSINKNKGIDKGKATWVGSLNEFSGWLNSDVEKQRFLVTIFLINMLVIIFGLLEFYHRKDKLEIDKQRPTNRQPTIRAGLRRLTFTKSTNDKGKQK